MAKSTLSSSQAEVVRGDGVLAAATALNVAVLPTAGGAMTGNLELAAGVAAGPPPLTFQAGTSLTTAAVGAAEFDGTCFYLTAAASSRQVVDTEQIQVLTSANTLTSDTNPHPIFNATTNGALQVAATTTYLFEMLIIGSAFSSSSHTLSLSFALANSATLTSIAYLAQTAVAAGGAVSTYSSAVATATAVTAATTSTALNALVKGVICVNAAGTIAPTITQGTAAGAAASIGVGSYVRLWPVGSNTVTNVGDWS